MQKLIEGFQRFRGALTEEDLSHQAELAKGQSPETLVIACSDSRVVPSLFTQSQPGSIFEIQTAGNLVPAYRAEAGCGIAATIEYGISALKVKHVVICGHSQCGAMGGLFSPEALAAMPDVGDWLMHAESARRVALLRQAVEDPSAGPTPELVQAAVEANVEAQLANLRTHPSVATGLDNGSLEVHGWVYHIGNADLRAYDAATGEFTSAQ